MLRHRPHFSVDDAARIARDVYGVDGTVVAWPSERDQNFLIETPEGRRTVLKIANGGEDPAVLEAQRRVLAHLAATSPLFARLVPTARAAEAEEVPGRNGDRHVVWMLSYLAGQPLASLRERSPRLFEDLGRAVGAMRTALDRFDHAAVHRDFYWDLAHARATVAEHRARIADPALGAAIDTLAGRFDRDTAPVLETLPRGVVHGDLNDQNVLVHSTDGPNETSVSGILDFGDMVYSYAISDLAIAAAYVALGSTGDDPLVDVASLIRGYVEDHAITDDECAALFGLIAMRLCASACIAVRQRAENPENDYLDVSQRAIRRLLPVLAATPFGYAHAVVREAAGGAPVPAADRIRAWLDSRPGGFAPVIDADSGPAGYLPLDLGVASPLISGDARENAEPLLTRRIFRIMADAGATVAAGGYGEPRVLYSTPLFAAGEDAGAERRTVHLGVDLFAAAGTEVRAPLAGTVHLFADNAAALDYGPVIILRHATDDGTPFFTLYGHLSRESLTGLEAGEPIAPGQRLATLGTPEVNGGWTPHLHVQIITDLLDLGIDYPGVARPSQRAIWLAFSPDPNGLLGIPVERRPKAPKTKEHTRKARERLLGRNLSLGYREPVRVVRGWKQFLFDDQARRYLDAYNNVPHVGHCHPRVVAAGQAQMALLNTNTRYLSDVVVEYAERLAATLPEPLRVCYFLNSASEANELALRLAREHTKARDMIVLEAAYHGNTNALIDLSPYKHAGPGGRGAPEWVHVAPLPDDYRGRYRRDDARAGVKYAGHIDGIIEQMTRTDRRVAGFIAESCPSVGGQIILPPGYLAAVYRSVRRAGGVCIADEVQTGLGRIGTHFWAFEAQGVVPDIVVMGKPLGNGHPLAAVVTTRAIADSFDTGMEFFSTFGGNTVSCAIGLAVLDVVRDEQLQAHALRVGDQMLQALRPWPDRLALVGDVRGSGLFLGVELVRDRESLEPAAREATSVVDRMREEGILLGTDGPHHNVIKIRPPMPFDAADADVLIARLERAIAATDARTPRDRPR